MSKLEDQIEKFFVENNIEFEKQKHMPLENWPWKTDRSKGAPKCDFYLPKIELYVEVKGFMTIEAMSKMGWLANQANFNYYILQGTEYEWNIPVGNFVQLKEETPSSVSGQLRYNVKHQLEEIKHLYINGSTLIRTNLLSSIRLKMFLEKKAEIFKSWNGYWVEG